MNTAWCGVERGSASSTSPPVTAPAARDHVAVPRATAAPGSRLDRLLTLPPPSTKSEKMNPQNPQMTKYACRQA